MIATVGTPLARHWVTHTGAGRQHAACGATYSPAVYPPVSMPGVCVDCPRCARQLEAFELATLTAERVTA